MIFFSIMFFCLFLSSLFIYCWVLMCDYHGLHMCWPISTCFQLQIFKFKHTLKALHFLLPCHVLSFMSHFSDLESWMSSLGELHRLLWNYPPPMLNFLHMTYHRNLWKSLIQKLHLFIYFIHMSQNCALGSWGKGSTSVKFQSEYQNQ